MQFDEGVLEELVGQVKNSNTQWSAYSQKMEIIVKSYIIL